MKNLSVFFLIVLLFSACMKSEKPAALKSSYTPATPKLASDIMTPEVLWSFGRIGGTQVSPDGKSVLYGVTFFNIAENKSYRDIYVIAVNGGEAKKLTDTPEKEGEEQWRPDGKKIGYISAQSGTPQLWEMNPDGGAKVQVSNVTDGISGFKYSPDLKNILYIRSVKLDKDIHDLYPDLPLANARLETDLMYRHWDSWHDYTYQHIVVAGYSDGVLSGEKDIMEGERYDSPMKPMGGVEQINWSPDGKTVAYTCKKKAGIAYATSTNSDIYLYNLETGVTTNLTEGMMGYDVNPVYSNDGQKIAWESMARDGYEADKNRLFVADLKT
jgi:Tol biopolymer transport system component